MNESTVRSKYPIMAIAMISLLLGIWTGLRRMGWGLPTLGDMLVLEHGPLMVSGFMGTLVSLERALAVGKRWSFLGPMATAVGSLAIVSGSFEALGAGLIALGSLILVLMFASMPREHLGGAILVMAWGALAWFVGNDLWFLGFPINQVVIWWMGFLVLTVAGERLELGQFGRRWPANRLSFLISIGLLLLGMVISVWGFELGARLAGAGMVSLGSWLLRFDVARRTARSEGQAAYIGRALLSGYVWLMLAGALGVLFGGAQAGPMYDAILHSVFLGFALVMIFAHAPIMLVAMLNLTVRYSRWLYAPLIILHASLLLRVGGDVLGASWARQWGALGNALAILAFPFLMVATARSGKIQPAT